MYRGTKDIMLPTTVTGSLPRPSWYTENLGSKHFLEAMVSRRFREQYEDALTCYLRDQEIAGLDIVTDGDCRFDDDVGFREAVEAQRGFDPGEPFVHLLLGQATLLDSARIVPLDGRQATVESSRLRDATGRSPVFCSRKQPVP